MDNSEDALLADIAFRAQDRTKLHWVNTLNHQKTNQNITPMHEWDMEGMEHPRHGGRRF